MTSIISVYLIRGYSRCYQTEQLRYFIAYAKEDQSVQVPSLTTLILGFENGPAVIWTPLPPPIKAVKTMPNLIGKELVSSVAVMVIPLLNADGESPAIFVLSIKIRCSLFNRFVWPIFRM